MQHVTPKHHNQDSDKNKNKNNYKIIIIFAGHSTSCPLTVGKIRILHVTGFETSFTRAVSICSLNKNSVHHQSIELPLNYHTPFIH